MKSYCGLFLFALALFLATVNGAHAEGENRVRLKVSNNTTQGTILVYDHSVGFGLDYSHQFLDYLELGVSGTDVFFAAGANLYAVSFNPALTVTMDSFHFYAGPLVGALIRREDTGGVMFNSSTLGLGGFAGVDFEAIDQWFLNGSFEYIGSNDNSNLSILSFAAGIGLRF